MRATMLSASLLVTTLLIPAPASAAGRLPKEDVVSVPAIGDGFCVSNLFQSKMVVQRDKPVAVWGWAAPGDEVSVEFAGHSAKSVAAADRSWKVTFPPVAGGPESRTMILRCRDATITLQDILVGDVWVLGGQSNMEFPIESVENGNLEIVSANHPHIRLLTIPFQVGPKTRTGFARLNEWSSWFSRHFRKGDWETCTPETVREFSAIGYVFARRIHAAAGIPIGVIDASRGGTTVETWTPDAVLRKLESPQVKARLADWDKKIAEFDPKADLEKRVRQHDDFVSRQKAKGQPVPADRKTPADLRPGPAADANRPGNSFAGMIGPLQGLSVKGAIFHQGFNNCFDGTDGTIMYGHIFPHMITAWRAAFNDPAMPFGVISLCTAGEPQTRDDYLERTDDVGAFIREAQYRTFLNLYKAGDTNVGYASSYDLRRKWYHPQLKIPAGERIARWALSTQYGFGKKVEWKPPAVIETKVEDGRITLMFDMPVASPLGGAIEGFSIAGDDRRFQPVDAVYGVGGKDAQGRPVIDKKTLVLAGPLVAKPVHWRYAWARNPMANLQADGFKDIPFATQRSDDWKMEYIYSTMSGDTDVTGMLTRQQHDRFRKLLRAEDMRRRVHEARKLLEKFESESAPK